MQFIDLQQGDELSDEGMALWLGTMHANTHMSVCTDMTSSLNTLQRNINREMVLTFKYYCLISTKVYFYYLKVTYYILYSGKQHHKIKRKKTTL